MFGQRKLSDLISIQTLQCSWEHVAASFKFMHFLCAGQTSTELFTSKMSVFSPQSFTIKEFHTRRRLAQLPVPTHSLLVYSQH